MRSESSIPRRTTANLDAGATPTSTSSSRTSGLTATSASVLAREVSLDRAERACPNGVELPLQHVAVERVDDDRRPCVAREACRESPDGAGLRGVRVEDVRPVAADHLAEPHFTAACIPERRNLALELGDRLDLDPALLGDERHRRLALGDRPCREGRRVAALGETLAEVGDVERRTADVESCDHAQHADRIVGRFPSTGANGTGCGRGNVHCAGARTEDGFLGLARRSRVDASSATRSRPRSRRGCDRGPCARTTAPSRP